MMPSPPTTPVRRALLRLGVAALAICAAFGGYGVPRPPYSPVLPAARSAEETPPAKQAIALPMRDGVRLATDIHRPAGDGPFPVIVARSTYDKSQAEGVAREAVRRGYVFVAQHTRGRFDSQGANLPWEGDGWAGGLADGYDTLEWIARQPWCNGRIGTWGGSALSISQMLTAGSAPPHLSSQHLAVGAPSLYHYAVFTGGVPRKALIEDWLKATAFAPNALSLWRAHPNYDAFWRDRDLASRWGRVNVPAMHQGGWFDIFTQGTLDAFVGYQTRGGPKARGRQKLVIGPWTHGLFQPKAGELVFPANSTKPPNAVGDAWQWFDYTLKDEANELSRAPAVTYYVMGDTSDPKAPGNEWRTSDRWPVPAVATPIYLQADRSLRRAQPSGDGRLGYTYDPRNPVPTVGGPQLTIPAGPMEQRSVEGRPDVLVFSSKPLERPLEVTGPVTLKLWASSDAPDTDFIARLCDVYPDGRSYNLCEGALRARYRRSLSRPEPLKPGRPVELTLSLASTSIVLNRGHRLRLHVTSSCYPGYEPNPNTGERLGASSTVRTAHNTVWMSPARPSRLVLPVVAPAGG